MQQVKIVIVGSMIAFLAVSAAALKRHEATKGVITENNGGTTTASHAPATPTFVLGERLTRTLKVAGVEREYIVHLPKTALPSGRSYPILFVFHPAGAPASFMEQNAPFYDNPDAATFAVVYPQGYARTFNVGDCCAGAADKGVDDVAFLTAMMADVKTLVPIRDKAYVTGFSNGAFMTYRLLCDVPNLIAAAAPYAGAISMDSCVTGYKVPVLHINGGEDSTTLLADKTKASSRFTEAMNVIVKPFVALDAIAQRNGCSVQHVPSTGIDAWGATCEAYKNCPTSAPVSMCVIPGLGHAWPGSGDAQASGARPLTTQSDGLGPFRPELDSTGPIVDFLLKH